MRITGGEWRGRRLKAPRAGVRPTQDRVREALFSILGARTAEARVLDLFAGSGSVGLEALSRGAGAACWIEADRRTADVLRANVAALGAAGLGRVVCRDVYRALVAGGAGGAYDLVYADPPYAAAVEAAARRVRLLEAVAAAGALCPGGWCVLEEAAGRGAVADGAVLPAGWRSVTDRAYGTTRLLIVERDESRPAQTR
jgi:16S rRNA (guanine966-N2)-methyltransferase